MIQKSAHSVARSLIGFGVLLFVAVTLGCVTAPDPELGFQQDKKARAHYNAGVEQMRQGKLALAVREFRVALQISPRDPWIHWAIAEAYRQKDRLDDSRRLFARPRAPTTDSRSPSARSSADSRTAS